MVGDTLVCIDQTAPTLEPIVRTARVCVKLKGEASTVASETANKQQALLTFQNTSARHGGQIWSNPCPQTQPNPCNAPTASENVARRQQDGRFLW